MYSERVATDIVVGKRNLAVLGDAAVVSRKLLYWKLIIIVFYNGTGQPAVGMHDSHSFSHADR
jgi:hypothetical protein